MKKRSVILLLLFSAFAPAIHAQSPQGPPSFSFNKNDTVAIYGNGLADRMQHHAWVETVLQSQLKDLDVRFRNLSFSGDTVNKKPRNKGFYQDEEYLKIVAPDVIFLFFGYNESYAGAEGAEKYSADLAKLVSKYRDISSKQGKDIRFVLFSPIAFENTGDPNLPNGITQNATLAAYTEATRRAAATAGATYVDLYSPTFQLFESSSDRFTINGIHLNDAGYRRLADMISAALLGKTVSAGSQLDAIREAVKEKNWHWHNRFRALDGNDIWGSRSGLRFVEGQSNADVLTHELTMLDVMTTNRDKAIWAAAAGKKIEIDDSNVPKPVEVLSNVGGKSRSSSAQKEGNLDYLSPEESMAKIAVPDGYQLNVFASEVQFPDLANPVQMQVDAKGRLWAAAWNTYPKWQPDKPMNDSLMIFEDTDNDGKADKRIIFANIHCPLGFEFWGGGVIVTSGPDLWFLKDTDGDDKADVRYILLQGLGTADTHHAANNLVYGSDGGIYWQSGIFLVHNHETPWNQNLNIGASGMYRFDPRRFTISPHAGNSPNPHGTSFDYWGYCYANDGTGGRSFQVRPEGKGFKMYTLLNKEFRPVAADAVMSSSHFPEDMQGDFLICNTIGFLGVKQYDLDKDGDGDKRKLGEVWGTPGLELLKSADKNFRPTDAVIGEDGALYVSDWHNVIIGHMQHNIRDPNRDHAHGRIFRLTVKDRPLQKPVKIHGQPIEALLENLKHPVDGVRHRTRVELSARDSTEVIAETRKWMKGFNPNDEKEAHHLLEALWLHQQHNVRDEDLLNQLLNSQVPHAVVAAKTVKHFWHNVDVTSTHTFLADAEAEPKVEFTPPKHFSSNEKEFYKLGAEVFTRDSHCMTCHPSHGKGLPNIYPPLVDSPWVTGNENRLVKATLHGLWGKIAVKGKTYDPARGVPPMTAFGSILTDKELAAVLTFVRNSWGNQASIVSPETVKQIRNANLDRTIFWKPDELLELHPLSATEIAQNGEITEAFSNDALEKELLEIPSAELARLAHAKGDAARGKKLFYSEVGTCFACHDPPNGAIRIGPDLTKLRKNLTDEHFIDSVLRPSKSIEKEFVQFDVLTVNGKVISGVRVSENNKEIVLKNQVNPEPIKIAKEDIDEMEESDLSMMPAGLSKQFKNRGQFYDIIKYVLESYKQ
jgi:putative heme-binding domain-containing protein